VEVVLTSGGGLEVTVSSSPEHTKMSKEEIQEVTSEVLHDYAITSARVHLEYFNALPFALLARVETAVRRLGGTYDRPHVRGATVTILQVLSSAANLLSSENAHTKGVERLRRTFLFVPGNEPRKMLNAAGARPDAIVLDLEDSVQAADKDAARILVRHALSAVDFRGAEKIVRINDAYWAFQDLDEIIGFGVQTVMIPKCEAPEYVRAIGGKIIHLKANRKIKAPICLIPTIESPVGVLKAVEVASASADVVALMIDVVDYLQYIGADVTQGSVASLMARSTVVNAARAARVQPLESDWTETRGDEEFQQSTRDAKSLGFDGRGCTHPQQVRSVHACFAPSPAEIDHAKQVLAAVEAAKPATAILGSKTVSAQAVARASRVLHIAEKLDLIATPRSSGTC
jgi:citrate lyase subunit beta/citryl-CoA lyase